MTGTRWNEYFVYIRKPDGKLRRVYHANGAMRWVPGDVTFTASQVKNIARPWAGNRYELVVKNVFPYVRLKDGAHWPDRDVVADLHRHGKLVGDVNLIRSGLRTYAEQQALYTQNMYSNGTPRPGRPLTAYPGTSRHESGRAADVGTSPTKANPNGTNIGDTKVGRWAAAKVGLCFPVAGESWHVEPIGG